MSWLLLLLATHPEVQEKAREEAMRVLPTAGEPIEWQHLDQLTYLTAVIKETQRSVFFLSIINKYFTKYPVYCHSGCSMTCAC